MERRSAGVLATAAVIVIASGQPPAGAQQRGGEQASPFRSGVEVVSVDVSVVDRTGTPVRNLTERDFIVTVDGRPRRVVTAQFIERESAPAGAAAPAAVSTNDGAGVGRLFAFIVDQSTIDLGTARQIASAAAPLFSRLTFADRSTLMLMPTGPSVGFTWAHDRVRTALGLVTGTGQASVGWDRGSLADARDISNRTPYALRTLGERECGAGTSGAGVAAGGGGAPRPSGGAASGSSAPLSGAGGGESIAASACMRELLAEADSAWRLAHTNSLANLSVLQQYFGKLARVPGDKTVILMSGGLPLDDRDQAAQLSRVAADAAAARVTLHAVFIPPTAFAAERRTIPAAAASDMFLHAGPLESLAAMTGGRAFRADGGSASTFARLARELSGHYRIGVEKDASDAHGKDRRLKVQVPRSGASIVAREIFDMPTYEDRDWPARLASALEAPVVATDIGLRVTSYVGTDPDDRSRLRLLVAGEASRMQPGEGSLRLLVSDLQGKKVASGDVQIEGHPNTDHPTPFSTNISVLPGSYIVRLGLMDAAGRVGSVDHAVEVRPVKAGSIAMTGPVLVCVPPDDVADAHLALGRVAQDERLAIEVGLEADQARLETLGVDVEIAASADGPALLRAAAAVSKNSAEGGALAQAVANVRLLPPGPYVVRATVRSGSETIGHVMRPVEVVARSALTANAAGPAAPAGERPIAAVARTPVVAAAPFAASQVLSADVLHVFLDRVEARPDAASSTARDLLERVRADGPAALEPPDFLPVGDPAVPFVRGLALLARGQVEPAAAAFRQAMRVSADFYPAMVYLGACYAAGGHDKEAANAWRTALIKESDALPLHVLLADAFLRQGRPDLALEDLDAARARWPEDVGLLKRFAVAALLAGRQAEGLQALDALLERRAEDDRSLEIALLVLYEGYVAGDPIESADRDRARMVRLADRYRTRGGPSMALIDAWLAAAGK